MRRILLWTAPGQRLGRAGGSSAELQAATREGLERWRTLRNSDRLPFSARDVAELVERSLERLWIELAPGGESVRRHPIARPPRSRHWYTHFTRSVYHLCMGKVRTNIEIEDTYLVAIMDRYGVHTKTEAVDLALRHLAGQPMSRDEALAMRGARAIDRVPDDAVPTT